MLCFAFLSLHFKSTRFEPISGLSWRERLVQFCWIWWLGFRYKDQRLLVTSVLQNRTCLSPNACADVYHSSLHCWSYFLNNPCNLWRTCVSGYVHLSFHAVWCTGLGLGSQLRGFRGRWCGTRNQLGRAKAHLHPLWCCRPQPAELLLVHLKASRSLLTSAAWAAPTSPARVEVALTPGRRRCSRCNSTVCVSHTQNRTGSPAPHRLARAASAVAEDSGRSSGAERSEDGWGTHSPERFIDSICKGISSQFIRFLKEEEYCDKWLQF